MMSKEIKFRTKFLQSIEGQDITKVEKAFREFIQLNQSSAQDYLWRLTYETDENACKTLDELGMADLSVDRIKLRNELRYQYGSNLLKKPSTDSFSEMEKKSDTITAFVVWKHCKRKAGVMGPGEIQRALYLLSAEEEKQYFGGIRTLGFNVSEADYLKQFHTEIGEMFQYVWNEGSQPFGNQLGEALKEFTLDKSPEEPAEQDKTQTASEKTAAKQVTAEPKPQKQEEESSSRFFYYFSGEDVLTNREAFENFTDKGDKDSIKRLRELGYDLNEVFGKEQEIREFIDALRKLEG